MVQAHQKQIHAWNEDRQRVSDNESNLELAQSLVPFDKLGYCMVEL